MRIVYLGTPEEAVPPLLALMKAGHEVALCITAPDARAGRGRRVRESAVKSAARKLDLPFLTPQNINDMEVVKELQKLSFDVLVLVAFGQILSAEVLSLPKYASLNVHFSLLPQYRGAAPVEHTLMNGSRETGVTIILMSPQVDAGDIILQESCEIWEADTTERLKIKMAWLGADLLLQALARLERGELSSQRQRSSPSRAPKLKKDALWIDWASPASKIWGQIRAAAPSPGATTWLNGKRVKILCARVVPFDDKAEPGEIIAIPSDGILIAAGEDALLMQELQMEGKKRLPAREFLKGVKLRPGNKFEKPPGGEGNVRTRP